MQGKRWRREIPIAALATSAVLHLLLAPQRGDAGVLLLLLLGFGCLNLVFVVPGTWPIRSFSLGLICAVLLLSVDVDGVVPAMALYAVFIWPLLLISASTMERRRERSDADLGGEATASPETQRARTILAGVIATVAIGVLAYRALVAGHLEQTSALFIGVPAVLAIVTALFSTPRTAVGVSCKAVTIFLLITMIFLWEGVLCVVMAAPLFYLVAVAVGTSIEQLRNRRKGASTAFSCLFLLALVPASLEGVMRATTIARSEVISATRIIPVPPADVARALRETPRFERTPGLYLRAGFPRPIGMRFTKEGDATRWVIAVRGGEMKINGMEPRTGDVVLALDEDRPGLMRWRVLSDDSHVTHFLWWRDSTVAWEAAGPDATRVTWTLRYERGLDPAWYFGPFERYAVGLAAEYLIDAVATP